MIKENRFLLAQPNPTTSKSYKQQMKFFIELKINLWVGEKCKKGILIAEDKIKRENLSLKNMHSLLPIIFASCVYCIRLNRKEYVVWWHISHLYYGVKNILRDPLCTHFYSKYTLLPLLCDVKLWNPIVILFCGILLQLCPNALLQTNNYIL